MAFPPYSSPDVPTNMLDPPSQMAYEPDFPMFVHMLLLTLGIVVIIYLGIVVGVPLCRWLNDHKNEKTDEDEDIELLADIDHRGDDEKVDDEDPIPPVYIYELANETLPRYEDVTIEHKSPSLDSNPSEEFVDESLQDLPQPKVPGIIIGDQCLPDLPNIGESEDEFESFPPFIVEVAKHVHFQEEVEILPPVRYEIREPDSRSLSYFEDDDEDDVPPELYYEERERKWWRGTRLDVVWEGEEDQC